MRVLKKELWPHCVTLPIDDTQSKIDEVEIWLGQRMGAYKGQWNAVYNRGRTDFYFKRGPDATMFVLRWGT